MERDQVGIISCVEGVICPGSNMSVSFISCL